MATMGWVDALSMGLDTKGPLARPSVLTS